MVHDRQSKLNQAPLQDLLAILLRQFKALLAPIDLNDARIRDLAQQMAADAPPDADAKMLRDALIDRITESEQILARWDLDFPRALRTEMGDLPGWESTAEFLDLANEKSNAELRIAAGSVLVTALGDLCYIPYLLAAIEHDPREIETVAARRILSQRSGVDSESTDWLDQVRAWWDNQSNQS